MTAGSRRSIVVLISGRGSNLGALIKESGEPGCSYTVAQVFSDRPAAAGLAMAEDHGIPARAIVPRASADRDAYDAELAEAIARRGPALIVLAGFMRILSPRFVQAFEGRIMNIHPSLLPSHAGLHTHRRVLAAREPEHGATVHFVTEQLDGGPPILQARLSVAADDDEATLAARVLALEHKILPLAVRWYCDGRLRCLAGRAWLDGRPLQRAVQLADFGPDAGAAHATR